MESIIFSKISTTESIKKEKDNLEKTLKISIKIQGRKIIFSGKPFEEYEAYMVFEAINFGFPIKTALLLKDENMIFEKIKIKNFTKRKNLEIIKSRIIGTHGRTKRTIENLSDSKIIIKENQIGVICSAEDIANVITGLTNLIRGSKQSNVYKFLEKINAQNKIYK